MARELNQNLAAFLQSGVGANYASWCEIILPELPGSPFANQLGRVYRFATTGYKGGNLVIDSAQYEPYLKTLGEIKRTTTPQTETATLTLINTNNELGNVLLKDTDVLHGATVRCGRWWEDPKTATQYSYQQFKGVVDGIEANQDAITLTLISDLYAARTIGGGRKIDRACQFVFNSPAVRLADTGKGAQCAYTGTLTTCNKLYDDADGCSGRSNQAHYGGFVKLAGKNPVSGATAEAPNYQRVVDSGGTTLKMQPALKFTGATITNDNTNKLTEIDLTGSGNLDYYFVDADPYNGDVDAAVAAAEGAGGGIVYCGAGTYTVTGLSWTGRVFLMGAGEGVTIIYSTTNAPIIDISADASFRGGGVLRCTVRGSVTAGSSQIGIKCDDATYVYRCLIRDVRIEDCGDHGLYIGKAFSSRFENIFITNCADHPLLYNAANQPGNVFHSVYAGDMRSTGTTAFRIKAGEFVGFNCNGINSVPTGAKWMVVGKKNGVDGDATDSGAVVRLTDCNIESFDTHGILVYSSSLVDVRGRTVFAGNGNSNQIGIEFDLAGDGSSYYAQFITRGTIDDTVNFADGLSAYKNSQPIHANGFAPIQICGAGPSTGGGVPLSTYRNATAGATSKLANASGYSSIQTVTATTTIAQPGVKLIEVNNTSGGPITITIPWGGWYQSAQDVLIIKDVGGNAATHTITIAVGGGIGTLTTMTINGQALVLTPDGNTGSGTWRVVSSYPEYKLISETSGGVAIAGTLTAQDAYVEAYSASASTAPGYYRRRYRGSSGSPAAVQSGDTLAYDGWEGQYDTTVGHRQAGAYVTVTATENWDSTHAGTKVVISVAPNGSTDAFNKKWEFDGDNGLKRPGGAYIGDLQAARVYRSSTQSVNNISWTAITFDSETRDDGGFHSTSSNTDRMTAPATGWYQISANIEFVASSTGSRMVRFYLNGTTEIARAALASIATYSTFVPLTATYYLTASDYVTCDVFQDSGGSLNVGTSSFYQIHRVY